MAITITSPASGATVSGTINVTGTDGATVTATHGSTILGSVTVAAQSYSISVNTTALANGSQTLTVSDGTNTASVPVIVNNLTTGFAVTSPANGSTESATFTMSGTAGTEWVNVAVYNSAGTKVGADVTPSGGTWSTTINMGAVSGSQVLTATAFSVPAGQPGGTSTSVNVTYTISGSLPYYGINCHYNQGGLYTNSLAEQVSLMSANGMTVCRQDCWNTATMQALVNTVIPGMPGITVLPAITSGPTGTSVSNAYTQGYNMGVSAANIFAGLVPVIEMGNEFDVACVNDNVDGTIPSDFSSSAPLYVAYQAGLCNGFRSVDTTGKTKVMLGGIAYIHFGFLDMIVNNIEPNGSVMPTAAATFDMIAWHYYFSGGNMESVNGLSGTYNIFTSIAAISTKPLYFSECGLGQASSSTSTSTGEGYVNQAMPQFVSQSQVVGFNWYELYDFTDGYGLYNNSGAAYGWQSTLASFIAAHPES